MYNRYIPQPDGSYQRNRMQDQNRPKPPPPTPSPLPPCDPPPPSPMKPPQSFGILDFFKKLLPQGLDTADLLVILLILLMAGDCEEDRNSALLTLALYFFM